MTPSAMTKVFDKGEPEGQFFDVSAGTYTYHL